MHGVRLGRKRNEKDSARSLHGSDFPSPKSTVQKENERSLALTCFSIVQTPKPRRFENELEFGFINGVDNVN